MVVSKYRSLFMTHWTCLTYVVLEVCINIELLNLKILDFVSSRHCCAMHKDEKLEINVQIRILVKVMELILSLIYAPYIHL